MNSLRTSVEWPYGEITLLFKVMQSKDQKRYFLSTGLVNMSLHQQFHIVFFCITVTSVSMVTSLQNSSIYLLLL
jgi:hypothetical protein